MPNFADNFIYYKNSEKVIDDLIYRTDAEVQAVYVEGGDGGNPTVVSESGSPIWKVGDFSVNFPITHSTGTSTWDGSINVTDASDYTGVTSGTPTQGKVKVGFARSSQTEVTAVTIRIGSDSSNYAEWTPTLPTTTSMVSMEEDLSALSITGTPDWTNVDYVQIRATSTAGTPDIDLSGLRFTEDTRVTDGVWDETPDQFATDKGKSLIWMAERQQRTTMLVSDGVGSTHNSIHLVANNTYPSAFTMVSKFRWRGSGGAGKEIGVAFKVTDVTDGSEDGYVVYIDESDNEINFDEYTAGVKSNIATASFTPNNNTFYWLKVEYDTSTYQISISTDGLTYIKYIQIADSTHTDGQVGTFTSGIVTAEYEDFYIHTHHYVRFGQFDFNMRNMLTLNTVQEDSGPQQETQTINVANTDKSTFIQKNFRSKFIHARGNLNTPTEEDLTRTIDDMKDLLSEEQQNLVVGKPTGTPGIFDERLYVANAIDLDDMLKREHWHKTFMPYNLTFQATDGFAKRPNTIEIPEYAWDTSSFTRVYNFEGNAPPLPTIVFELTDATPAVGDLDVIEIENLSTSRTVSLNNATTFSDGDLIEFNFATQEVLLNSDPVAYTGRLSDDFFRPGINKVQFSLGSTDNLNVSQEQNDGFSVAIANFDIGGYAWYAQSFEVTATTTYPRFDLNMRAMGSPNDPFTITIETDTGGSGPSGTIVNAGAEKEINQSNFSTSYSWVRFDLDTAASLTATTPYWMVFTSDTTSAPGSYQIQRTDSPDVYADGQIAFSDDQAASWDLSSYSTADVMFRIYSAGPTGINGNLGVSYRPRFI